MAGILIFYFSFFHFTSTFNLPPILLFRPFRNFFHPALCYVFKILIYIFFMRVPPAVDDFGGKLATPYKVIKNILIVKFRISHYFIPALQEVVIGGILQFSILTFNPSQCAPAGYFFLAVIKKLYKHGTHFSRCKQNALTTHHPGPL